MMGGGFAESSRSTGLIYLPTRDGVLDTGLSVAPRMLPGTWVRYLQGCALWGPAQPILEARMHDGKKR